MIRSLCLERHIFHLNASSTTSLIILPARRSFTQTAILTAAKRRLRRASPPPQQRFSSPPPQTANEASLDRPLEIIKDALPASTYSSAPHTSTRGPYPPVLRIYERSARRIALLGIIRLTPTIMVTLWSANIGLTLLDSDIPVHWPQLFQAFAAFLPILVVVPWTSGYAARILLQIPPEARRSKAALEKWLGSEQVGDALVEIKSVRANGFSWATTQCRVGEMRAKDTTLLSPYNFMRVVDPRTDRKASGPVWRRLYALISEPPRMFKIAAEEGMGSSLVKEKGVWNTIAKRIMAQSGTKS